MPELDRLATSGKQQATREVEDEPIEMVDFTSVPVSMSSLAAPDRRVPSKHEFGCLAPRLQALARAAWTIRQPGIDRGSHFGEFRKI